MILNSRKSLTAIGSGVGFLLGGLVGLLVSLGFNSEGTVIACYTLGAMAGASVGSLATNRWHARRRIAIDDPP